MPPVDQRSKFEGRRLGTGCVILIAQVLCLLVAFPFRASNAEPASVTVTAAFEVLAAGKGGRAIVRATLSDGRIGIFWARAHRLSQIWIQDPLDEREVLWDAAAAATNGSVALPIQHTGSPLPSFMIVAPGKRPRFVESPLSIDDLHPVCTVDLEQLAINPREELAFSVAGCGSQYDRVHAIYRSDGVDSRILVQSRPPTFTLPDFDFLFSETFRIEAIRDDGDVIATASIYHENAQFNSTQVLQLGDTIQTLVEDGTPLLPSMPGSWLEFVTANRHGDIAFIPIDSPFLHTHLPYLLRNGDVTALPADPDRIGDIWSGFQFALTSAGDVVFADLGSPNNNVFSGTVYVVGIDGSVRGVFSCEHDGDPGCEGRANDDLVFGDDNTIAFSVTQNDQTSARSVVVWSNDTLTTVMAAGDPLVEATMADSSGCNLSPASSGVGIGFHALIALLLLRAPLLSSRPVQRHDS